MISASNMIVSPDNIRLMTVGEVALFTGYTPDRIRRFIESGKLRAGRIGNGEWRLRSDHVLEDFGLANDSANRTGYSLTGEQADRELRKRAGEMREKYKRIKREGKNEL